MHQPTRNIGYGWALVLALFVGLGQALPSRAQAPAREKAAVAESAAKEHSLSRVAFIGASVSAGFGNARELKVGRNVPLGKYFEQMLGADPKTHVIHNFGSSQFFTSPLRLGASQLEKAQEVQPTLVVGIDFLFWYAFGYPRPGNPRRVEGLQKGLHRLESLSCQLIIGDLPNVDHALQGQSPLRAGHPILQKGQLPSEAERARMNKLIHAWAAERKNVHVFPLAELMERMISGEEMKLRGNAWKVEKLDQILQEDLLHPRSRGMVWVALYVADFTLALPDVGADNFVWKEDSIKRTLWNALGPERAKQAALEARRKERRAKRDKQKQANQGTGV